MRLADLLAMSLNNLKRRKLRTSLTVLGVVIGTAAIVVMVSLGIGLNELNRELIESYGSLTAIEVQSDYWGDDDGNAEDRFLKDATVDMILNLDHVVSVYPLLQTDIMLRQGRYSVGTQLTGAPREYLEQIPLGQGQLPDPGSKELQLIYGNAVIQWFSSDRARDNYWETGKLPEVDFMGKPMFVTFDMDSYYGSSDSSGEQQAKPPKKYIIRAAGVVEGDVNEYNDYAYGIYADLDLLKAQLRRVYRRGHIPGQPTNKKGKPYNYIVYNSLVVNVDKMENVQQLQEFLNDLGYQTYSRADWMEQSEKQSGMIQAVLGGIGAVSLFVAAIGIANTMMMSIYERTKEIGVIKVLGCDMGAIRNMFLMESGFIGLMGGIIGVAASYSVSYCLNRFLKIGEAMTGMAGNISRIPLWLSGAAITFAILVGMAAGFFPAQRAMRLSPLAAIRNE